MSGQFKALLHISLMKFFFFARKTDFKLKLFQNRQQIKQFDYFNKSK